MNCYLLRSSHHSDKTKKRKNYSIFVQLSQKYNAIKNCNIRYTYIIIINNWIASPNFHDILFLKYSLLIDHKNH